MQDQISKQILNYPTLFIGYGFHDNLVERVIANTITNPKQDIWVMCLENQTAEINYYRQLGCKIIIGDTNSFLQWVNETFTQKEKH